MKEHKWISGLFFIAAAYDGILGIVFLLFPLALFNYFGVTPPNHVGYVQFPAGLLVVFALMFAAIALKPVQNRNLIPYGILLKVCYCAVVFGHWFVQGVPGMWKPFAVADVCFGLLFLWAYAHLAKSGKT